MELWSIQTIMRLCDLQNLRHLQIWSVSLPLGLLVNSNTSLVQVFFPRIFRLSYELSASYYTRGTLLSIYHLIPTFCIWLLHRTYIVLLCLLFRKVQKEARKWKEKMWKLYIRLRIYLNRRKKMLCCFIAIRNMQMWFMTKPQAWGYGRPAWTAGAFDSLTNGQALPPTLYNINP